MKARLWTILLLTTLVVGACGGDGATTTSADTGTTNTSADTGTTAAEGGDDLLAQDPGRRRDRGLDRPRLSAPVGVEPHDQ